MYLFCILKITAQAQPDTEPIPVEQPVYVGGHSLNYDPEKGKVAAEVGGAALVTGVILHFIADYGWVLVFA